MNTEVNVALLEIVLAHEQKRKLDLEMELREVNAVISDTAFLIQRARAAPQEKPDASAN